MEKSYINFIKCGELEIAASCEINVIDEGAAYYPSTILLYVEQGEVHICIDQEMHTIKKGGFGLIRKYTEVKYVKTFTKEEKAIKSYAFILTNSILRRLVKNIIIPDNLSPMGERVVKLPETAQLKSLMQSVINITSQGEDMDTQLVELKTNEALMAILKSDPRLAAIFREYSLAERADLVKFMNHNYLYNISLQDLASHSGRSLSTFNREFKMVYNETPHRWIMRKRLNYAHNLLLQGNLSPSEVYIQTGFEDLAHFSRAFKKQFNIPPSKVKALAS